MEDIINTPVFDTPGDFVRWMRYAVKMDRFKMVPATATAIFVDGTVETAPAGKRGGTIAANFSFMISTFTGRMAHPGDAKLAENIRKRGGVMFVYTRKFQVGDTVLARYSDGEYYHARIINENGYGSYIVSWLDGTGDSVTTAVRSVS